MSFSLPKYTHPDFNALNLMDAPTIKLGIAPKDGVAPVNYHATSNYPEYIHLETGEWKLVHETRMDCVVVVKGEDLEIVEMRRLKKDDKVVIGRTENGEEGIFVHIEGFVNDSEGDSHADKFSFRTRGSRETPFSRSYDQLYDLLRHEREHGSIVWVLGPAVAFDRDSRQAMQELIEDGFCDALLAGNALATHDLEAACFRTGLGQDIYSQQLKPLGHYNHLDILNKVRLSGSIKDAIKELDVKDGIIYACEENNIPYVLAGSIRDDGPLPEVIPDVYNAQNSMREVAKTATTVIAMATQLHSIAFGNMTPSYRIMPDGVIRPVYYYVVDMSEFSADKLANRGSAQATAILTNVQDFLINLWKNLKS